MSALLLAVAPALGPLHASAQQEQKQEQEKKQDQTPAEQYAAVLGDFQTAQKEYLKLLQDAKTPEDRKEALKKRPDPAKFASRMIDIAEKNPKDDVAFDALAWVLKSVPAGNVANQAIAQLAKDHAANPKIGEVCMSLSKSANPDAVKLLRGVLDSNKDKNTQGLACYSLAMNLKNQSELAARQKKRGECRGTVRRGRENVRPRHQGLRRGQAPEIQPGRHGQTGPF